MCPFVYVICTNFKILLLGLMNFGAIVMPVNYSLCDEGIVMICHPFQETKQDTPKVREIMFNLCERRPSNTYIGKQSYDLLFESLHADNGFDFTEVSTTQHLNKSTHVIKSTHQNELSRLPIFQ